MINDVELTPLDKLRALHLLGLLQGHFRRPSTKSGPMQVPIRPVIKLEETITDTPEEIDELVIDLSGLMKGLDEPSF